jgi:hypothetical protein
MYDAVKVTRLRDVKLVWVDEAMFTFNTFSTRAWSAKIHPHSITAKEFIEFVEMLSDKFHGQEFAIFMDNLQVHKTKEVLETCK